MRQHNRFRYLLPAYNAEHVRSLLRPEFLVAARCEPVYSQRFEAYIDLSFERNGEWLVIPMLRVDAVSIMVPENPPLVWPSAYGEFSGPETDAIEELVVPWLQSITAGRFVNDESIRFFREDESLLEMFERARTEKWIGAAPYADVVRTIAPAVYALRFARKRRVAVKGVNAGNVAAVLSTSAARVDVAFADEEAEAKRWFAGLAFEPIATSVQYDAYVGPRSSAVDATFAVYTDGARETGERIVQLAEPIPTDVMLSFDLEDGPAALSFAIPEVPLETRRVQLNEPVAVGGSAGRIRLVVRDDAMRFGDSDLDAAQTLAGLLRAEGFDAEISIASRVEPEKADLIHVFDLRHGASLVSLLRDAEAARVPVVVTPYADDRNNEVITGVSGSLLIPRNTNDIVAFEDYAWAFARRKISNLSRGVWYDDASTVLLARACVALVASSAETDFLRDRLNYRGFAVPVPAVVSSTPASEAIGSLVGPDEFILIHAPIEPRMNQLFGAIAAQREGLPLVLLGPVADIEYYRYLNEIAGPDVIQLREEDLAPGQIAGIYGRARVVADLSWSSRGLHRLARGTATGAAPVAPANGYGRDVWGDLLTVIDPADVDSIAIALRRSWEQQPFMAGALVARTNERCDPFASLVAVVSAYKQAASVPA